MTDSGFLTKQWENFLYFTGENEMILYVIVPQILFLATFWTWGGLHLFIDMTGKPEFLYKYKMQEGEKITWTQVKKLTSVICKNQALNIPVAFLLPYAFKLRGLMSHGRDLPTLERALFELIMYSLFSEIFFYYIHRLLHYPYLFKKIHKVHHEWKTPIAICSIYCHPICDLLPALVGPVLFGSHLSLTYFWVVFNLVNVMNSHCGYHFPGFPSYEGHHHHHLMYNECFGLLDILDGFHNTKSAFSASIKNARHYTFFSWKPIKEIIPDPKDSKRH